MAKYAIGEARFEDQTLVEVAIQCMDEPGEPFLSECEVAPVSEVVRRLRLGDTALTFWRLPGDALGSIPVEVVTLPDGEESIEVVQRGQPEGYRMVNLPKLDATPDSTPQLD
jgi:hypothetical protein